MAGFNRGSLGEKGRGEEEPEAESSPGSEIRRGESEARG